MAYEKPERQNLEIAKGATGIWCKGITLLQKSKSGTQSHCMESRFLAFRMERKNEKNKRSRDAQFIGLSPTLCYMYLDVLIVIEYLTRKGVQLYISG